MLLVWGFHSLNQKGEENKGEERKRKVMWRGGDEKKV